MALREHKYKGHLIRECERVKGEHAGNWVVVGIEHGLERADDISPHFRTLKEAREALDSTHAGR